MNRQKEFVRQHGGEPSSARVRVVQKLTTKGDDDVRNVAHGVSLGEMQHAWDFPRTGRTAHQHDAVVLGKPRIHAVPPACVRLCVREVRHGIQGKAEHRCEGRLHAVARGLPELRTTSQDGLRDAVKSQIGQPDLPPRPDDSRSLANVCLRQWPVFADDFLEVH